MKHLAVQSNQAEMLSLAHFHSANLLPQDGSQVQFKPELSKHPVVTQFVDKCAYC